MIVVSSRGVEFDDHKPTDGTDQLESVRTFRGILAGLVLGALIWGACFALALGTVCAHPKLDSVALLGVVCLSAFLIIDASRRG